MPTRRLFLGSLAAAACVPGPRDSGDSGSTAAPAELDDTPLPPIIPNDEFYKVSISGFLPTSEEIAAWTLVVADEDGNTLTLLPSELSALGERDEERTISCIGSRTGRTMGNAIWGGLALAELLAAAGFEADVRFAWIRFTCGDGYTTTLPRSDLDLGLSLVWKMGGEALPANHGGPVRALTPTRYGMKNPKWIQRIDFVEELEAGFWEKAGWSQDANYHIISWFLEPTDRAVVSAGGVWLKGCAFAGEEPIAKVEVSVDDGASWQEAEITYAGGPGVWALWRLLWTPGSAGDFELRVRATTVSGQVQADVEDYDEDLDGLEAHDRRALTAV